MIRTEHLDFWIKNNYNVLFTGHAGIGKTSIVKDAFERNKLKWKYFSAATMDPWVDLIGIPKEISSPDGNNYLDLIRPKEFQNDEVEALFFDEFNRSHKKIRNAVMELIQFKSINGKEFKNLKIVWAAVNPEDDNYDVEKMDAAQTDRFHIQICLPYKPDNNYFKNKYGESLANSAISWWNDLPEESKKLVSPRRLDYALDIYLKNGDMKFVLPEKSNVSKLVSVIKTGPIDKLLSNFISENKKEDAAKFLAIENNYASAIKNIISSGTNLEFFLPLLTKEKISLLIAANKDIYQAIVSNSKLKQDPVIKEVMKSIYAANSNRKLVSKIKRDFKGDIEEPKKIPVNTNSNFINLNPAIVKPNNTFYKKKAYVQLHNSIHKKMTLEEAYHGLKVLENLIVSFQAATIQGLMPSASLVVNKLLAIIDNDISNYMNDYRKNFELTKTKYPFLFGKLNSCGVQVKIS